MEALTDTWCGGGAALRPPHDAGGSESPSAVHKGATSGLHDELRSDRRWNGDRLRIILIVDGHAGRVLDAQLVEDTLNPSDQLG